MTDAPNKSRRRRPSDEEILSEVPQARGGREVSVGVFVLLGIVSFLIVLFVLTDPATMRGRYILVTTVTDAGGVRRGDPIQMRGVNIGRIHSFEIEQGGDVAITMELEGEWPIPRGSTTRLGAAGIFGGRTMEILPGKGSEAYAEWDTLPGAGGSASGLMGSAEELTDQAGTLLQRLTTMLDDETVGTVQGSARELEQLLTDLSAVTQEQRGTLRRLTESLARSAEGLEDAAAAGPDVASAIARADSAMAVLTETGRNLDAAALSLRGLLARIDRGEGTLGRLATDDSLYENLNAAAESLTALLTDLQANPSKYINLSIF